MSYIRSKTATLVSFSQRRPSLLSQTERRGPDDLRLTPNKGIHTVGMRTLRKCRKLSHDNFVESYGVMSRSKSVDGRGSKKRNKTTSESTEMYGTFRRRKESHSSAEEEIQEDKADLNFNCNNNIDDEVEDNPSLKEQVYTDDEYPPSPLPLRDIKSEQKFKGPASRRLRRFSLKKFPSTGDIHKAVTRRTKSDGTENKAEGLEQESSSSLNNGWLSSWHSQFSINRNRAASPAARVASPKRSLYRIPATYLQTAAHCGYLDRRNKKRKWERFWYAVQESCLYCYNSPQSEFTHDATVLRGYVVSADISDVQRAKYTFKLEKKGAATLHFRCDDHKNFMSWICTINKETSDAVSDLSDNEIIMNNVKNSTEAAMRQRASSPYATSPVEGPNKRLTTRRHTADNLFRMSRQEHLNLELQKEKLLREVLEQQKEIIMERNSIMPSPTQIRPYYVPLVRDANSPKPTRNEVMEKYDRVKENHEMKILKSLTQLHRRRNSVQLKIDQLTRDTKPKSRRSRSASRHIIQSMEARLALLQSDLAEIDQDIREQHVSKEDLLENINHKRDLEIMVLDQQESLDIVKRHQNTNGRYQERGRRPSRRTSCTPLSFAQDHLTSIDEAPALSDSSSTTSGSNCSNRADSPDGVIAISSTPRRDKAHVTLENLSMGGERALDDDDYFRSCSNMANSKSSSCSSDADEIMSQGNSSVEGALSDDFRSLSTSSYSDLDADHAMRTRTSSSDESLGKKTSEIRPDVLAEIEEFEVFSKMMLQRINSTQC